MPGEGRGEGTVATQSIGPGSVLGGRYRLEAPLAAEVRAPDGSPALGRTSSTSPMPVFWLATDTVLTRPVALHIVPDADPRAAAMMGAARASAAVTDPHLLRVLDCDESDGVAWVVNEWADGTTLASVLHAGPLAPDRAARLTREVAEALASAHRSGVAHGRLRPEAVLLTEAGTVRLIGFAVDAALAHAAGPDPSSASGHTDPFGYQVADALQADVIDLAALLYAGLTGRWAGVAPSSLPLAPADARGPLRPRQVRAGVPRMLDLLCERVLRREAHEHAMPVETAHEILAALTNEVGDQATGVLAPEETAAGLSAPPSASHGAGDHAAPTPSINQPPAPTQAAASTGAEPTVVLPAGGPTTTAVPTAATVTDDPDATQAALPSADFVDSPERPLFAATDRRPPDRMRGSSAWLYGEAATTGTLDPVVDRPVGRRRRAGGARRIAAVSAVVLVVVAMVVAFEIGREGGGDTGRHPAAGPTTKAAADAPLKAVAVDDFDPEGHPSTENPDEVPRATDGNPGTGWTTLTYTRPDLGGLKSGVGLRVDLGRDRTVDSVDLLLKGSPTDLALYAAPRGESTAPRALDGLRRVARVRGAGRKVTLRPSAPVKTRYLIVWLTSLPPVGGGYRGEIDELTVRG